jgi:hypothetical protein
MPSRRSRKARLRAKSEAIDEAYAALRYTYSALPPGHIRILVLRPDEKSTVLRGKIIVGSPDELNYWALSYVWGNGEQSASILIGGRTLPITETLRCALLHLHDAESEETHIWIDQVCINQTSIAERNEQISRMGEIFAKAELVVAWLGDSTPATDYIFSALSQTDDRTATLAHTFESNELQPGHPIYESMQALLKARLLTLQRERPDVFVSEVFASEDATKDAAESILTNAWFTRTWTVQEAALCQRLFLVTGDSAVPWREFYGLLRTLNGDATVHYGVDFVREWFCYPNKYLGEVGQRLDLYELVESFQNRGATDPRDKIFGFFGLWNSKEVENKAAEVITQQGSSTTPTTKANILIPDYAKSVERVYIDFTIWNIQTTGDLTVLKNCCAQRALESNAIDIPSWAMDWSRKFNNDGCGWLNYNFLWGGPLPYKTALDTKSQVRHALCSRGAGGKVDGEEDLADPSLSLEALLTTGILFDIVEETVEHAYRTFRDWPAWVAFVLRSRVSQYPDRIEALWRTLIIDERGIGKRASLEDGAGFGPLISTENWRELVVWLSKRTSRHQKRKLLWTRRGFLGLACRHVQAGDKVCVLWGGRLPFILREQEGSVLIKDGSAKKAHVLIGGECYVHGLADGQGIDVARREGLNVEEICIV